ncbi:MFS transporter [Elizabethkingia miricola]|uniref:MFS transporter n=1 Tax=Elizabethkingia miricola TaxID=172045 RepID=UPI000B35F6FC|nr:MFS transporter [Elizabethkingia miricola]NHQ68638.1 MFS transporter [Elizabethkingia miricola]NHQ72292.1 MFS transporter [Elizabethkingia miricola]NHQ79570.1 MFS transporter [Elizabethkingia miricola]PSL87319.1 MFS transporter [Elizabethkingia miricola]QHQ85609.1 MFS transporter [Elizabethkingia miricola]
MQQLPLSSKLKYIFSIPVIISALGYFVDIYDLLLFGIVRIPSLKDLGLNPDADGTFILNCQMIGLLIGGVFWGIFGDKKGRLSVLFGSILVYSLANIACGFLPYFPKTNLVYTYALLRFIAGVGLAGELGAGITLVSESLPKELRAIGTSVVAGFGLMGAVVAQLTVELSGGWNISYIIGGGLGILLLFLRISVSESGIYKNIKHQSVSKGNFLSFFTSKDRLIRYLKCIAVGLPTWYCIGILAVLANQFAPELGIKDINPGKAIMWGYVGISVGDLMSGFISQMLKSRKKAIFYMLLFTIVGVGIMLFRNTNTETKYYAFCVWLGLGTGYWAMFVTLAAEQFGTNIRNTATTTVPNMVRGLVPVMILAFDFFKKDFSVILSAAIVGIIVFGLAFYSTLTISETHNKDLDFTE